ncbi:MAG: DNA translocase FtsK 4TM domain-containing protein [Deltaproteobacteria bacterium]|nr:DNA translocase FtsK 4TM domain-containing protein [Deltaproteobacteria bacterium]
MSRKRGNSRVAPSATSVDRAALHALLLEVAQVGVLVLGVFLLLSLITYRGLDPDGLPASGSWTGPAGAYLSFALYQITGHASLLVPVSLIIGALVSLAARRNAFHPLRVLGVVAVVVLASAILHVGWVGLTVRGGHMAGGAAGALLGDKMVGLFAGPGSFMLLTVGLLVLMVLLSGIGPRAFTSVLASIALRAGRQAASHAARAAVAAFSAAARLTRRAAPDAPPALEPEDEPDDAPEPEIHLRESAGRPDEDSDPPVRLPARSARQKPPRKTEHVAGAFELPPLSFLEEPPPAETTVSEEELKALAERLRETLTNYGVRGTVTGIFAGPVVTTVELRPEVGTKVSTIARLDDDLAMSLEVTKVRIVAPIPGKNAVGFELPTPKRETVYLSEILGDGQFSRDSVRLPLAVGKDIAGKPFVRDLARMPHLLIAGTTGSGKSVAINTILMSLLFKFTPEELRLILVDPKTVELQPYHGIPHLLLPVVTDMKHASSALRWAVDEMEKRYQKFSDLRTRDILSFNRKVEKLKAEAGAPDPDGGEDLEKLPYVVIVIDEFADLMMMSARDVEWAVTRLAAKARAAGIHLIVATQRPSVNVVTGLIKSNFPCRIAFKVASKVDSRVMLDTNGAESLLGEGDMLMLPPGTSELTRVHGAFVSDGEIHKVADFLREQAGPTYHEEILEAGDDDGLLDGLDDDVDERYGDAVLIVTNEKKASISYLQRKLRIGYNRAARIVERMEAEGIVGPSVPGKSQREVLVAPPAGT